MLLWLAAFRSYVAENRQFRCLLSMRNIIVQEVNLFLVWKDKLTFFLTQFFIAFLDVVQLNLQFGRKAILSVKLPIMLIVLLLIQ